MKKIYIVSVFFSTALFLAAQDSASIRFDVDYATEVQTNFGKKANWVNLLQVSAEAPTEKIDPHWTNGCFHFQWITVFKQFRERIADDLMTFSNIEEENVPFNPFMLGYTHQWGKITLFGGVRNVNHDYFATPYASLFTNSSAGIFPTLSINFPLANYPLSAVGLHLEYQPAEKWLLKTSLYNGTAHDPRKNILSPFTVRPFVDGVFSLSEWSYTGGKGIYSAGIAWQTLSRYKESTGSVWSALEHTVFDNGQQKAGFLLHGGLAPKNRNECYAYYAVGGYVAGMLSPRKPDKLGVYLNRAFFQNIEERTMELTWQYPLMERIVLQPTLHFIRTGNKTACIGLFRMLFSVYFE